MFVLSSVFKATDFHGKIRIIVFGLPVVLASLVKSRFKCCEEVSHEDMKLKENIFTRQCSIGSSNSQHELQEKNRNQLGESLF